MIIRIYQATKIIKISTCRAYHWLKAVTLLYRFQHVHLSCTLESLVKAIRQVTFSGPVHVSTGSFMKQIVKLKKFPYKSEVMAKSECCS